MGASAWVASSLVGSEGAARSAGAAGWQLGWPPDPEVLSPATGRGNNLENTKLWYIQALCISAHRKAHTSHSGCLTLAFPRLHMPGTGLEPDAAAHSPDPSPTMLVPLG
eukprot:552337-Pelagomonas_calceolata.AAC.1